MPRLPLLIAAFLLCILLPTQARDFPQEWQKAVSKVADTGIGTPESRVLWWTETECVVGTKGVVGDEAVWRIVKLLRVDHEGKNWKWKRVHVMNLESGTFPPGTMYRGIDLFREKPSPAKFLERWSGNAAFKGDHQRGTVYAENWIWFLGHVPEPFAR